MKLNMTDNPSTEGFKRKINLVQNFNGYGIALWLSLVVVLIMSLARPA